jgi:hypothetical protein
MKMKRLMSLCTLAALSMASIQANAGNIDATAARQAAGEFLKRHATSSMFKSINPNSIKLTHTQRSGVTGNAYYVFNFDGGGWVVIAGDDRAKQVLAYGENGSLDMNSLPTAAKGYLDRFQAQIECMQNYKGEVAPLKAPKRVQPIGPLMQTNWAQGNPFNRQCPQYGGEYSSVGCAGLAMAQILYYWKYPKNMPVVPSYQNSYNYQYIPQLPERTINYDLIIPQYTLFTESGTLAWVDGVTDEQKQEVAWLCRYAAQSCQMNFSPDGSGSNVEKQKNGFILLGYDSSAKLLGLEAWPARNTWNTTDYTDEEWVALINAQLEAKHPIPYSMEDFGDGHAFVVDGVDADGLYHVNWGWYGRGDGWFQYGAFNVSPTGGETYYFNDALFMVADLFPYEGYEPPVGPSDQKQGDVNGDGEVDVNDVTDLITYVLSGDAPATADVDGNTTVDVEDVTTLINMVLGAI